MERRVALEIFRKLEEARHEEEIAGPGAEGKWVVPVFDVRLDAATNGDDERRFRVRVSPATPGLITPDDWRFVLDTALEYDRYVTVQNSGLEIS